MAVHGRYERFLGREQRKCGVLVAPIMRRLQVDTGGYVRITVLVLPLRTLRKRWCVIGVSAVDFHSKRGVRALVDGCRSFPVARCIQETKQRHESPGIGSVDLACLALLFILTRFCV